MTSTTDLVPITEPSAADLIKTDVLGRMQRTREQRERILDEYERSGLRVSPVTSPKGSSLYCSHFS